MNSNETDVEGHVSMRGTAPRSIQSSGFLLALTHDWRVECVSANVGQFLGAEPAGLIGFCASTFLPDEIIHSLRNRLALLRDAEGIERLFACPLGSDGHTFDIAIHIAGAEVIVEAEPSTSKHYGDFTGTLRGMMARLDDAADVPGLCAAGSRQMRALSGFDRVIVTRLKEDGSGVVIAETARSSITSFASAKIPSSALARYERAAFRRTAMHVIADVEAAPVDVIGGPLADAAAPDLTRAVLRLASDGQADQLRLMGAQSSVTMALIVDDALWGIIACHHATPRRISFERRSMAELFARMFAMRIEIAELKHAAAGGD